ncbi:cyclophilin-like fold protein [Roseivivax sp. THAF30]|uniref:cyclophilin-like fold protein n=1 Tax=Roseivivax sp. THAF30 TaxID=2587852 RepID=UPI0012A9783B|nr:cyclophilin-like fold protein [Roseivivax sp. THAF30]QFT62019.1 hypothetical protein FIU91_03675 [Roseivivax sp. THAF30]
MRQQQATMAVALAAALCIGAFAYAQEEGKMIPITVTIGKETLAGTLDDSPAARDFAAMLPLDLTLSDYHGIEKVADLPRAVDTSNAPDSYTPKAGDITIYAPWGNLAIFYKPFQTSRGLVRLGAFDNPIDLMMQSGPFDVRIARAD